MPAPTRGDALRAAADLLDELPVTCDLSINWSDYTGEIDIQVPPHIPAVERVIALAMLADAVGNNNGPKLYPCGSQREPWRRVEGTRDGHPVRAWTSITHTEQAALVAYAASVE